MGRLRKLLFAGALAAALPMFGCWETEKPLVRWDVWRADRNEKAGNYRAAAEYRRRADQRWTDAEQHHFYEWRKR